MLLPGGDTDINYRDTYTGLAVPYRFYQTLINLHFHSGFKETGRKWQGFGFQSTAFSVLGGLPCISFPGTIIPKTSNSGADHQYSWAEIVQV